MFDDPNKALKTLQAKLMEAEQPEEFFQPLPPEDAPVQKYTATQTPPGKSSHKAALLVALLLLELAALLAVLAWWLLW